MTNRRALALLLTWCVVGAILRCVPGTTVLSPRPAQNDFFNPIPGAWALASGLKIHADFSSAMGPAYYLPALMALEVFGPTLRIINQGNAAIFVGVSVLAFLLLKPPRFPWPICALGVGLSSLLAANPVYFCESPLVVSEGSVNWFPIGLSCLCLLAPLSRTRKMSDAALLAGILAWLTFYKLNYLVVGAGYILIALITAWHSSRTCWLKFLLWLTGFYVLAAIAFVVWFHIDLAAMFRDIQMASAARCEFVFSAFPQSDFHGVARHGWPAVGLHLFRTLAANLIELLLIGLLLLWSKSRESARLAVAVLAVDLVQNWFNTYASSLPALPLIWLCLAALLRPGFPRFLASVAVGIHLLILSSGYLAAFIYNLKPPPIETVHREGARMLYLEPDGAYAHQLNEGLDLLRETDRTNSAIAVLDTFNLFPYLLRIPPPKGQSCWYFAEATYNNEYRLPSGILFGQVQTLMIPKHPSSEMELQTLSLLNHRYLKTNFVFYAENDGWSVWVRNP